MSGSMLTMPIIVMNMGGEMIYILEQRLRAQNIVKDKAAKVLTDVVRTMYSTKFISELFKPQPMYASPATRQIFDKLAHSSIMRLNESSMDKLYDLMTMGFKYQIISSRSPEDCIQVTLNHLQSIKEIVGDPTVDILIESATSATIDKYSKLSKADLVLLQQTLFQFFQDRRVKVSIFLQDSIQNMDGSIALNMAGPVCSGGTPPGLVTYYDGKGNKTGSRQISIFNAKKSEPEVIVKDMWNPKLLSVTLGLNMYAKNRNPSAGDGGSVNPPSSSSAPIHSAPMPHESTGAPKTDEDTTSKEAPSSKSSNSNSTSSTSRAELNLLADLLGRAAESEAESKPIKLTLFAEDPFCGYGSNTSNIIKTTTVVVDASKSRKANAQEIMSKLDMHDDVKGGEAKGGDGDDLLDLMDSAIGK